MYAMGVGGVDEVGLDHQVLVDELGRVAVVGMDAADLGRGQIDLVDAMGGEEGIDRVLVGEVEFVAAGGDDVGAAQRLQPADDGRADHAAMAGDEDGVGEVHVQGFSNFHGPQAQCTGLRECSVRVVCIRGQARSHRLSSSVSVATGT